MTDWEGIFKKRKGLNVTETNPEGLFKNKMNIRRGLRAGEMNKTEERFAKEYLELRKASGESLEWYFEAVKFRLARRTYYMPDFMEFVTHRVPNRELPVVMPPLIVKGKQILPDRRKIYIYEIKGHWEDDARVKIKVFAKMFPFFKVHAVKWINGSWQFEEVKG